MCTLVWTSWPSCQADPKHRVLQSICCCDHAQGPSEPDERRWGIGRRLGREVPERLRMVTCDHLRHATRPQASYLVCRKCANLPLDTDDLPVFDPDTVPYLANGSGNNNTADTTTNTAGNNNDNNENNDSSGSNTNGNNSSGKNKGSQQ